MNSLHRRRSTLTSGPFRRLTTQWRTVAWLTLVWVALWGDLSWGNVVAGVVIACAVMVLLPLPSVATRGTARPWPVLVLLARFVSDLFTASFQVAALAVDPRRTAHGAVVGVRLRNPSDVYMTLTAELTSLVPGSLVIEAHRLTGMLYLHVLDVDQAGGIEKVRADTLALEARVLHAFATNDELRAAGLYQREDADPVAPRTGGGRPGRATGADEGTGT
ncbi:Na+/H+ antiporter subunit E [Cellulosimicrobium sp. CUA-896]|uniref:Na+/H+ antiporter subunit E n=1 Tax=Cellulosimicrobium sp. CUA-896 TaxID=1517881 RepID=UPI000959AE32|nr:Na+/H+ antiporter subunit E [Cellulosimicrobium sp. CUA-896]OLT50910.1 Na+/H+ antiporter subunit E [Cellulosimicrobium sp. CUA-896]